MDARPVRVARVVKSPARLESAARYRLRTSLGASQRGVPHRWRQPRSVSALHFSHRSYLRGSRIGLELPVIRPHQVDFLERDEAEALYEATGEIGQCWRALIELGTEVGLRPGELYGLQVIDVATRSGLRQWPKSKKSHRVVPVPAHIMEGMSALMAGRPRDVLVFTAPEGGPVDDGNFRDRIWYPAVKAASIRRFPPRIMRHTAASWLVMDGVPLYDVQALLGARELSHNRAIRASRT
jgi:integrase